MPGEERGGPDEVQASPQELGRLAGRSLDESIALFDALQAARGELPLPAAAIGDTEQGAAVADQHALAVEAAGTAVERLVSVLEQDMDSLYQTAFNYQEEDRAGENELLDAVGSFLDEAGDRLPRPWEWRPGG